MFWRGLLRLMGVAGVAMALMTAIAIMAALVVLPPAHANEIDPDVMMQHFTGEISLMGRRNPIGSGVRCNSRAAMMRLAGAMDHSEMSLEIFERDHPDCAMGPVDVDAFPSCDDGTCKAVVVALDGIIDIDGHGFVILRLVTPVRDEAGGIRPYEFWSWVTLMQARGARYSEDT